MERDYLTPAEIELDHALAAVLDDFPLSPLPEGFVPATMRRISPPPRFQLQFLDLALPFLSGVLFLTLLVGFSWFAGLLTPTWLPEPAGLLPELVAFLRQIPPSAILVSVIAVEAALVVVAGVSVALWLDRPLTFAAPAPHGRT